MLSSTDHSHLPFQDPDTPGNQRLSGRLERIFMILFLVAFVAGLGSSHLLTVLASESFTYIDRVRALTRHCSREPNQTSVFRSFSHSVASRHPYNVCVHADQQRQNKKSHHPTAAGPPSGRGHIGPIVAFCLSRVDKPASTTYANTHLSEPTELGAIGWIDLSPYLTPVR